MYREETRKARKQHRCAGCGQRIEPGQTYLHIVGHSYEGDFGSEDYHPDCRAWEAFLCQENNLRAGEWMTLADHVSEGGRGVLDGAPEAVRARFPVEVQ